MQVREEQFPLVARLVGHDAVVGHDAGPLLHICFFSWLLADCLLAGSLDLPLVPGKATRLSSYRSLMPLEISSLVKTMALSLEILPVCFFSGREGNMSAIRLAINPAVTSGCSSTIRRHCGCPFPLNLFA